MPTEKLESVEMLNVYIQNMRLKCAQLC